MSNLAVAGPPVLAGRDILSIDSLTLSEVDLILDTAEHLDMALQSGEQRTNMAGRILATLFYEPSTRTRLSFESAMLRLGGTVISVAEGKATTSAAKGETLYDTGKMLESYAHVAVIRHPERGAAEALARGAAIPVINGGDGTGEHPTQALLDLYTIRRERGSIRGQTIALIGDLKHGRTVHSLAKALARYGVSFFFVGPSELAMPADITAAVRDLGCSVVATPDLEAALGQSDVLYMTRVQRERFTDPQEYERLRDSYRLDLPLLDRARPGVTIMHPLPRVDEIAPAVDGWKGAAYFRQAAWGVPIRMAILALVAGRLVARARSAHDVVGSPRPAA